MRMLRQRKAPRPSFCRSLICTFHRRLTGIAKTANRRILSDGYYKKTLGKEVHTQQIRKYIKSDGYSAHLACVLNRAGYCQKRFSRATLWKNKAKEAYKQPTRHEGMQ